MTPADATRQAYRDTIAQLRAGLSAAAILRRAARDADRYRRAGANALAATVTTATRRAVADVLRRRIEQ